MLRSLGELANFGVGIQRIQEGFSERAAKEMISPRRSVSLQERRGRQRAYTWPAWEDLGETEAFTTKLFPFFRSRDVCELVVSQKGCPL